MSINSIRVAGASGFWGDSARATKQLLAVPNLDYIVYDYLAEITMSIMARARAKDANQGYARDFITAAMAPNLALISELGVKIVSNAGGVNPLACAQSLRALISAAGLDLRVACVLGDDLITSVEELEKSEFREMFSGEHFPKPDRILSANAYLGAFPIARALEQGADIVVTGRCVDSAVTLAACLHKFKWEFDAWDLLAMGSLAGHIIECGPQATGGNFTDWELVGNIAEIGYPVAEILETGVFRCFKPNGTSGLVTVGSVSEQMLYEIGDPQSYILPDVTCDFSEVELRQVAQDIVEVTGARGRNRPEALKLCVTFFDQFRGGTYMTYYGVDAAKKAKSMADAIFAAARMNLQDLGLPDFSETSVEVLGSEDQLGKAAQNGAWREVVLKIAAKHQSSEGIGTMLRAATGLALATPPGLCGFAGSRPSPSPVVRLFSTLIPRNQVAPHVDLDGITIEYSEPVFAKQVDSNAFANQPPESLGERVDGVEVPLIKLAYGRSGDKGNKVNVGIISRRSEYYPYICASITEAVVTDRFSHFLQNTGPEAVTRYLLPGSHSLNFLLTDILGGGGVASLRNDPQGKGYAQILLMAPVAIPKGLAAEL